MRPLLTIATWNLGGDGCRLGNIPLVADALVAADADLVLLQEVMRGDGWADVRYGVNQVDDLARRCGYPFSAWLDTSALPPHLGSGVKMVGLLSRFELSGYAPQPAIEDPIANGIYRALEVQADIDGTTWFVYTVRFSAHNYANFAEHCRLLDERIAALPPDAPLIVGGDFNGGAHLHDLWHASTQTDLSILHELPPPIARLVANHGLQSVTDGWPLRDQPPVPPCIEATDLILFRKPIERVRAVESRPPAGATDQWGFALGPDHALVVADLAPRGTAVALAAADLLLARRPVPKPPRRRWP